MATFILLHGSFHAAWNWHKVVPILENKDHQGIAIDLPGHGLDSQSLHTVRLKHCVDKVCKLIDSLDEKVILLSHSRNGMVISQVVEYRPQKVEKLIYLAAYLIPDGKSMMDYGKLDVNSMVFQNVHPKTSSKKIQKVSKMFKNPFLRFLISRLPSQIKRVHCLDKKVFILTTCKTIKEERANSYHSASEAIARGLHVSGFTDYYMRLNQIDFQMGRKMVPVNRGLKMALEEVLQYYTYRPIPNTGKCCV